MSESRKAIFLSYASQDAGAAQRICEPLRAAGIEVWFDQSELRGGDAWDQKIRRQIRDCALFIPIISAQTQARSEGYFRLEWRLADQRTQLMGRSRPFVMPVCVDDTPEPEADVPDSFAAVQWTRCPTGGVPLAFVERVVQLLSPDGQAAPAPVHALSAGTLARTPAPDPQAHGSTADKSIAVLPFTSWSGDPEKDYFGDGISEELIHLLSRVPGLKVPARTSSFAYKGRNVHVRQIAHDLGVSMLLEGSVRAAGNRIRVTAQLIEAETGYHVWSQTYDRQFEDVFKLQDELAGAIVRALRINLDATQAAALREAPPTNDIQAYQLYLQADAIQAAGGGDDARRTERAVEMLKGSIERDPGFARAHALLGAVRNQQFNLGAHGPEILGEAQRSVERALALDPDLAIAHQLLGQQQAVRGQWAAAEASFQRARALAPAEASTLAGYPAYVLGPAGKLQQALVTSRECYRLAPAVVSAVVTVTIFSFLAGDVPEAAGYLRVLADLGYGNSPSTHILRSEVARMSRQYPEAAAAMKVAIPATIRAQGSDEVLDLVYAALADAGRAPAALAALRALNQDGDPAVLDGWPMIMLLVDWYTMLGALDDAYRVAHRIADGYARTGVLNAFNLVQLWLPELRAFRLDPRFQDLTVRLGLMAYWQEQGPPDNCELRNGRLIVH